MSVELLAKHNNRDIEKLSSQDHLFIRRPTISPLFYTMTIVGRWMPKALGLRLNLADFIVQ